MVASKHVEPPISLGGDSDRRKQPTGISHHAGKSPDSVPRLRTKGVGHRALTRHCLFVVARDCEKCGLIFAISLRQRTELFSASHKEPEVHPAVCCATLGRGERDGLGTEGRLRELPITAKKRICKQEQTETDDDRRAETGNPGKRFDALPDR